MINHVLLTIQYSSQMFDNKELGRSKHGFQVRTYSVEITLELNLITRSQKLTV